MRFRWALLLGAGATLFAVAAGCEDSFIGIASCGEIPAGGCPRRGDTCADVTCDAVYTCADGAWTRIASCPAHEAGPDAPAFDAGKEDADAAPPSDASWLDVPGSNGGPGCAELEPPDCPLGLAASCPNGCCGCEELFVCRNGGWEFWGTCPDAGFSSP